jgi:hypothetical protein
MFLLIILGILAIAGIVGTFVLVPRGQDNRYADRQWHSATRDTFHIS